MLTITVPEVELFNEETNEITFLKSRTLTLEHSLISLAKWESKWHKPFLSKDQKTDAEVLDYIKMMTLDKNVDPIVYDCLSNKNIDDIDTYIHDSMTATWFNESNEKLNKEIITSEIIYYWMIVNNIPFECQKWHLNRLLTLIKVCGIKNSDPKKMSKKEIYDQQRALNEARKKKLKTKG